jgi:hypothetical protein
MEKLIENYRTQILGLEKDIEASTENIRSVRRKNLATNEYYTETEDYRLERSVASAKVQTLLQVIKDLEDID